VILCSWLIAHGSSCLEAVAVLFGIVSVFLSVRENIWSWPTAIVNVSLYFALFFKSLGLLVVLLATLEHRILRQIPRRFDELRIIESDQGLQRGIRPLAADRAHLAARFS
jgi:nicotinamide mononucleotide transporter